MKEPGRIEYLDTAKGIAVLLVIIGHIYSMLPIPIGAGITSLHNPTFYAASGILLAAGSAELNENVAVVLKKKFVRLIIPFGLWSLIYASVLYFAWGGVFVNWLADAMNKLWFLPVLFVSTVGIIVIQRLGIKPVVVIVAGMCGIIFGVFVSSVIAKFCTYVLIVYLGYILYQLDEEEKDRISKMAIGVWGILLLAYSYGKMMNTGNKVDVFCLLIHLLCSIAGGISLIYLLSIFHEILYCRIKKCLVYIGKNSLYFYILHFTAIYYLELTSGKTVFTYIAVTVAAVILPLIVSILVKNTVVEKILF